MDTPRSGRFCEPIALLGVGKSADFDGPTATAAGALCALRGDKTGGDGALALSELCSDCSDKLRTAGILSGSRTGADGAAGAADTDGTTRTVPDIGATTEVAATEEPGSPSWAPR